jgi:IS5 family transposase
MPVDWKPAKCRQKDTDARWTRKHGKFYCGCRVSANACKRYKLVRKIIVSVASEHDTLHFENVLDPANTNRNILADKDYAGGERETRLSKQGWPNDKPISVTQERRNHSIEKMRARIEQMFAGLAQMCGKALRSIALARATLHRNWKLITDNLQRLAYLKEYQDRSDARIPSGLPISKAKLPKRPE